MSLFRKPKKIQRRVFSSNADDEDDEQKNGDFVGGDGGGGGDSMDMDLIAPPPPPIISKKDKTKKLNKSDGSDSKKDKTKALLSFADDEDDGEVFQVRKSSHSKKVMRMMDKERRKKKREERSETQHSAWENGNGSHHSTQYRNSDGSGSLGSVASSIAKNTLSSSGGGGTGSTKYRNTDADSKAAEQCKSKKSDNIQTEIRTDDFVLVVKKSETTPSVVLNGRAALCAGRDDMSDDDEDDVNDNADNKNERNGRHRFSKPEHLKQVLESGSIPDAAMIHAARKRRQRAREQGDFIPIEEPKEQPKQSSRLPREDMEGDQSDDEERMDMNDITGRKEREERREQFYAVENDLTDEDSDHEANEWENQQIRKGVTGAQLVNAQNESVLSRFMIKPQSNALEYEVQPQSTSSLLEQAYAKNAMEKPQQMFAASAVASKVKKEKVKPSALRTPKEIRDAIRNRLSSLRELNDKHAEDMERISQELKTLKVEEYNCKQKAPLAAAKYRFYQEVKCYVNDLIDCLNVKAPMINELEKRYLQLYAKHQNFLVERRRQDVRDQAKEMAEASKPTSSLRRTPETEEHVRRAAEREGRRTRRRCERERVELMSSHLDGMSSDDETQDQYQEQFQQSHAQIEQIAQECFSDVNDEFHHVDMILMKFFAWRSTDFESYKDAYVSLCLPKILGPLVRMEMLQWSPLLDDYKDIENMNWYGACMLYACSDQETTEQLKSDPDINLVPTIIERIVLPKLTEIVRQCWDPLSTSQTLRLISFVNRLGRDYPLKSTNKQLKQLFEVILERMRLSLENDVFIPIFPKQVQEAKTSFFQRQFCSGLKLFRNFLSWQGIIADKPLRSLAIGALLNRYLLLAMRVCTANDAISKAYIIVNTLPTVWLQPNSDTLKNLELLINYIRQTLENCDATNPLFMQSCDKAKQILQRLHSL